MGKKKSAKGKLPKRIAGVKMPRQARRQAEKAIAELQQPIVREMIAGAIGMAAAALAKQARSVASAPHSVAPHKVAPTPEEPKREASKSGGEQFAEIATGLAMAGLGRLFERMSTAGAAEKAPAPKA